MALPSGELDEPFPTGGTGRSWHRGYEAGRAEGRKLAVIGIVVAAVTLWRHPVVRGHSHFIPWALMASMVLAIMIVLAVPFVLAGFGIRAGVRRCRRWTARGKAIEAELASISPGNPSKDWEPF